MKTLLSLLLKIIIINSVLPQKESEPCLFPTGEEGRCKLHFECKQSTKNNSMFVTLCSFRGISPIVCCYDIDSPIDKEIKSRDLPPSLNRDTDLSTKSPFIPKLRRLKYYMQKIGYLTKPKSCPKADLSEIISLARKEIIENTQTNRPFGTRRDRIARYNRRTLSPDELLDLALYPESRRPKYDYDKEKEIGSTTSLVNVVGIVDGFVYPIYFLNWTRDYLIDHGYATEVISRYYDAIDNLAFWNLTSCHSVSFDYVILDRSISISSRITGGKTALRMRSTFMALLGEKAIKGNTFWGCDGVLVNFNWILTAAHCFVIRGFKPNIVRLGEYNRTEETKDLYSNFPEDFGIRKVVFHPRFNLRTRYNDLALVCLGRLVPQLSHSFNPIQLPWNFTENNFVGDVLTLTGWGSTAYLNPMKSETLLEVNLTVFNSVYCDVFYSNLIDYQRKWPLGISEDKLLCVGDNNGMKDSCQGDSGAPLTLTANGRFILIAIVSTGYGCGLKNYPGLYTPVYVKENLNWIKTIAFRSNSNM